MNEESAPKDLAKAETVELAGLPSAASSLDAPLGLGDMNQASVHGSEQGLSVGFEGLAAALAQAAAEAPGSATRVLKADSDGRLPVSQLEVPPGLLEQFEILGELGHGGMGKIFRGRERAGGGDVVIKVMPEVKRDSLRWHRFKREAASLALLHHPNIVRHFDHGACWEGDVGRPYLVMEYLPGQDLHELSHDRREAGQLPPPIDPLVDQFIQLAEALLAVHQKGLVHRDLKPDNVVMVGEKPVLIDFGLVKIDSDSFNESMTGFSADLTATGELVGTLIYMAPEQFFGRNKEVGTAADVWGFGATMYHALCARPPFNCRNIGQLAEFMESRRPPLVSSFARGTPPWLDRLLGRCLRREIDQRPSMAELLETLRANSAGVIAARARRRRLLMGLALVAGIAALGGLLFWLQ